MRVDALLRVAEQRDMALVVLVVSLAQVAVSPLDARLTRNGRLLGSSGNWETRRFAISPGGRCLSIDTTVRLACGRISEIDLTLEL